MVVLILGYNVVDIGILDFGGKRWQVSLGNQQACPHKALPSQAITTTIIIITVMLVILNAIFALT